MQTLLLLNEDPLIVQSYISKVQVGVKITALTKNSGTISYMLNEPVYVMINRLELLTSACRTYFLRWVLKLPEV